MLLRGQNLLGYKHYADDVVEYFVKSISNGIDIIRIFDALNDVRNIEASIRACKKEGGHAQELFANQSARCTTSSCLSRMQKAC